MDLKGKRVLLIDDDKENLELLMEFLSREGHTITTAGDGATALHRAKAWKPHLILLDVTLPTGSGIDLIPKLRANAAEEYAPIMLVSSNMAMEDVNRGLDAGADDYLTKPFRPQELAARVRAMLRMKELQDALRRANHRIDELSSNDDLTGLLNLRALQRRGDEEVLRCRRFRKPVSALLINVDQFSILNATHGFQFGSQILRLIAGTLKQCVRSMDLVGRVGADEYMIVLPETDLSGAEFVAERIREAVEKAEYKAEKHTAKVTACLGVSGFPAERAEGDFGELYRNANEALRSGKAGGPNRVEIYSFV